MKILTHPKRKRLFRPELPLHVVLKSSRARGKFSLLLHNASVTKILTKQAQKHFVAIKSAANAGNHLHLLIEVPSQNHLSAFLRAIAGRIAEHVYSGKGFWDGRPFSRIVCRGKDEKNVARYLCLNSSESAGLLPRSPGLVATGFV